MLEGEGRLLCSLLERPEKNTVGIEKDFPYDEAHVRFQDPLQLSKSSLTLGDLAKDAHEVGTVEGVIGIGELLCIAPLRSNVSDPSRARPAHHVIEHLLL